MSSKDNIKILAVSFSPRPKGNTVAVLEEAADSAASVPGVTVEHYSLAGKKIAPCIGCNRCGDLGTCCFKDSFQEFMEKWLEADGLIYASPVYHYAVPAVAKAAIEKLSHVMFARFNRRVPRFSKVGGVLAQGSSRYGGQEAVLQFLINSLLIMNCIPVAGETPSSYVGAPGFAPTWERGSIKQDTESIAVARDVGRRVAEMAWVVKEGIQVRKPFLGDEYTCSAK